MDELRAGVDVDGPKGEVGLEGEGGCRCSESGAGPFTIELAVVYDTSIKASLGFCDGPLVDVGGDIDKEGEETVPSVTSEPPGLLLL